MALLGFSGNLQKSSLPFCSSEKAKPLISIWATSISLSVSDAGSKPWITQV